MEATEMEPEESRELAEFRAEARAWLAENFPASLAHAPSLSMEGAMKMSPDMKLWAKRMGDKGWGTPTFPKKYGGGGLTKPQARVLAQELARIGAQNPIVGMGPGMFGATLLEYGSEEQKARHFPPICRGELRWCQGYSEPGAGSDLASLQTRAEDKGDHYLVNGQKIWTSGAQYADWCFCLVRTDRTRKHDGISFLLIDMRSPGVEVRPILMISGASGQCETFFTDVKVPKENLMGQLNGGWAIAKRLLQHERSGMGGSERASPTENDVVALAKKYVGCDADNRITDKDLRARLAQLKIDEHALRQTVRRATAEARGNSNPSATTSIMKNAFMRVMQLRAELTLEIMGNRGLGWEGQGFESFELESVRQWLGGKAGTIYGGTSEVQNNIISKRILGLPEADHAKSG